MRDVDVSGLAGTPGETETRGEAKTPGGVETPGGAETPGGVETPGGTETPGGAKTPGAISDPGRRRGRRPAGEDTRGVILAAARAEFGSRGYDGTTIRGIARAAGVDARLVHHY